MAAVEALPVATPESAQPVEAVAPAASTETSAADKDIKSDPVKASKPARRPLSSLIPGFGKPRKSSAGATPAVVSENEKDASPEVPTVSVIPEQPVQPATVDIGAPSTDKEAQSVPAIVSADTSGQTEPIAAADQNEGSTSPRKEKKDTFFDKIKNALAGDKKPSADKAVVDKPVSGKTENDHEASPAVEPIEPKVDETAPIEPEASDNAPVEKSPAKVSRRLSARLFGGIKSAKKDSKLTEGKDAGVTDASDVKESAGEESAGENGAAKAPESVAPEVPAKIEAPIAQGSAVEASATEIKADETPAVSEGTDSTVKAEAATPAANAA